MKHFVSAKIHGIRVTDKSIEYNGSVSICPHLMAMAGIDEHEKVQIVNLNNGQRWETYALKGDMYAFTLNGGGARLGEIGDECVVITYKLAETFESARVIFVDEQNLERGRMLYENS